MFTSMEKTHYNTINCISTFIHVNNYYNTLNVLNEKSKRICQKLTTRISLLETYRELHISTYIMNILKKVVFINTNTTLHEKVIVS